MRSYRHQEPWQHVLYIQSGLQELTIAKAELFSAQSEGSKHKDKCSALQSQNASLSSELKHTQQSLTAAQVMLRLIFCHRLSPHLNCSPT